MIREARFYEAFPFLKAVPIVQKQCYCHGKNETISVPDSQFVKARIAAMNTVDRQKLKKLLDAAEVRVILPGEKGKVNMVKF